MPKVKRLFWDIETAPNLVFAWSAGFKLNIPYQAIITERRVLTIAWKWEGEKKVYHLTWDENQDDRKMLAEFTEVANQADELVAHYGDRFDILWFRTRCLILGLPPIPEYKTVDTKSWASKKFYFNSNKLDYIAEVLGLGNKLKTGVKLWKDIILHKSASALQKMVTYNKRDVEILEGVFHKMQVFTKPKTHVGVFEGGPRWSCPRCGGTHVILSKTRVTATGLKQYQMKCQDDGAYYQVSATAMKEYEESKCPRKRKRDIQNPID